MRGFEIMATVIGVCFVIGIAVGMLLFIPLPPLPRMPWNRRHRPRYMNDGGNGWNQPPRNDHDRRPPPWPGG